MPVKGKHLLHYVPHGINTDVFKPIDSNDASLKKLYKNFFNDEKYNFIIGFNSRNSHRKHPANLVAAFRNFCDHLTKEESDKCALILHSDKVCDQGTDLIAVVDAICPQYKVIVDENRYTPEEMCLFYNICDVVANVSSNEGFGLSIAESIVCGTPVIATVTGGLQDQLGITDDDGNQLQFNLEFSTNSTGKYKKHGCWAKPIWANTQTLQGSPPTPYIMDDIIDYKQISDAIMYWYLTGHENREKFGLLGRNWAMNEGGISSKNMCEQFINAMDYTLNNFNSAKKFDVYSYNEDFNIKNLPNNSLGYEPHKIDIEKIKKELL